MSMGSILCKFPSIRRRRVVLAIAGLWLLYFFFQHLPTDVPPVSKRVDSRFDPARVAVGSQNAIDTKDQQLDALNTQTYDGPVKFYNLGAALRAGYSRNDARHNVLFAISNLKSTSHIIPLACEMAQYNRTRVHLAFMGREEIETKNILSVNGLLESDCPLTWYDGRPDYARQSTDARMEHSIGASLGHIQRYLSPRAVIIDASVREDPFFTKTMEEITNLLSLQLITLPKSGWDSISWISTLDGVSLKHWGKAHVDIVIHAAAESSGSLVRLLKSIKDADYSGFSFPRLTIELPTKVDQFTTKYLSEYRWPPGSNIADSKLVLRHRVDTKQLSPVYASLRTIESFYPIYPTTSHALVLSPDIELSRSFFQFTMYALLEFKYGSQTSSLSKRLVGFSLDLPTYDLIEPNKPSPFSGDQAQPMSLWQAPTSQAGLYFGDKWVELHAFLERYLANDPNMSQKVGTGQTISDEHPAWLKVMFELMRTQGYFMLYPTGIQHGGSPIVTVHRESHRLPEEYANSEDVDPAQKKVLSELDIKDEEILTGGEAAIAKDKGEEKPILGSTSVATLLLGPNRQHQRLVTITDNVPVFSTDGKQVDWKEVHKQTSIYANQFAMSVGKCVSLDERDKTREDSIEYLFCAT